MLKRLSASLQPNRSSSYDSDARAGPSHAYSYNSSYNDSYSSLSPHLGGGPTSPALRTSLGGGYGDSYFPSGTSASPLASPGRLYSNSNNVSNVSVGSGRSFTAGQSATTAAIDTATLHKSLKAIETLLVTLDECTELQNRLAKAEKRLARNARDLADDIGDSKATRKQTKPSVPSTHGDHNSTGEYMYSSTVSIASTDEVPYANAVQALISSSSFFDILSEVSTKSSKLIQKEYDNVNEVCGKIFKRIAKDEKAIDEALFSLDAKLKKANFDYDRRVRAENQKYHNGIGSGGAGGAASAAAAAHQQYVPLLAALTDEIAAVKHRHGQAVAAKRDAATREIARTLTNLSDVTFRRSCENVRKLGSEIGGLLALQALLGPFNIDADKTMPDSWPEYLQNVSQDMPSPPQRSFASTALDLTQASSSAPHSSTRTDDSRPSLMMSMHASSNDQGGDIRSTAGQLQGERRDWPVGTNSINDNEATVRARSFAQKPPSNSSFSQPLPDDTVSPRSPILPQAEVENDPQTSSPQSSRQNAKQRQGQMQPALRQVSSQSDTDKDDNSRFTHVSTHSREEHSTSPPLPSPHLSTGDLSKFETHVERETKRPSRRPVEQPQRRVVTMPSGFICEDTDQSLIESSGVGDKASSVSLERTPSIESDTSQSSFVQRMRAKYAGGRSTPPRDVISPRGSRPPPSTTATADSTTFRVSKMAQQYEQTTRQPDTSTIRPSHRPRQSLPTTSVAVMHEDMEDVLDRQHVRSGARSAQSGLHAGAFDSFRAADDGSRGGSRTLADLQAIASASGTTNRRDYRRVSMPLSTQSSSYR